MHGIRVSSLCIRTVNSNVLWYVHVLLFWVSEFISIWVKEFKIIGLCTGMLLSPISTHLWQKYAFLVELLFMRIHYVLRRWTSCALCSVKGTARFIMFLRNEMGNFSCTSFKLLQFLCIHCQTQLLLPMVLFKQETRTLTSQEGPRIGAWCPWLLTYWHNMSIFKS